MCNLIGLTKTCNPLFTGETLFYRRNPFLQEKRRRRDAITGVSQFVVDWVSQASANQRAGQTGVFTISSLTRCFYAFQSRILYLVSFQKPFQSNLHKKCMPFDIAQWLLFSSLRSVINLLLFRFRYIFAWINDAFCRFTVP